MGWHCLYLIKYSSTRNAFSTFRNLQPYTEFHWESNIRKILTNFSVKRKKTKNNNILASIIYPLYYLFISFLFFNIDSILVVIAKGSISFELVLVCVQECKIYYSGLAFTEEIKVSPISGQGYHNISWVLFLLHYLAFLPWPLPERQAIQDLTHWPSNKQTKTNVSAKSATGVEE